MESGAEQSFVTKKDLEATKQELLAKLATKEEQKKLATKTESEILANEIASINTRLTSVEGRLTSVEGRLTSVEVRLISVEGRLISVEDQLSSVEENTHLILQAVDGIARKFDDYQTEKAATEHTFKRHGNRLDEHETRIETLEGKEVS